MDLFQAMALIGFDGPDSSSSPGEVRAEIARLLKPQNPPHWLVAGRIAEMERLLASPTSPLSL